MGGGVVVRQRYSIYASVTFENIYPVVMQDENFRRRLMRLAKSRRNTE